MDPNNSQQPQGAIFSSGSAPAPSAPENNLIFTDAPVKEKKSKKGIIIFGIAVLLVALVGFIIFQAIMRSENSDKKIALILKNNLEIIESVDSFFYLIDAGSFTFSDLRSDENRTMIKNLSEGLQKFEKDLSGINLSYVNSSFSNKMLFIKNTTNIVAPNFSDSAVLYEDIYDAYIKNDPSRLKELLNAELSKEQSDRNENKISVLNRFVNYFDTKANLENKIISHRCDRNNLPQYEPTVNLESCDYLTYSLNDINKSINDSTVVVSNIFLDSYHPNRDSSISKDANYILSTIDGGSSNE